MRYRRVFIVQARTEAHQPLGLLALWKAPPKMFKRKCTPLGSSPIDNANPLRRRRGLRKDRANVLATQTWRKKNGQIEDGLLGVTHTDKLKPIWDPSIGISKKKKICLSHPRLPRPGNSTEKNWVDRLPLNPTSHMFLL